MTGVRDEHAIPASGTIKVHAITRHLCGCINKVPLESQFTRSSCNMKPEENVDKRGELCDMERLPDNKSGFGLVQFETRKNVFAQTVDKSPPDLR